MPITGPASYIPTTAAFLSHWTQASAALGAEGPVTLAGTPLGSNVPVTQAMLETLYTQISEQHTTIQDDINGLELARGELDDRRTALNDKLVEFNEKVRADLAGSKWERALPAVASSGSAQSYITDPMDDAKSLWTRIEAAGVIEGGTLKLRGGYTSADFAADLVALKAAYRAVGDADLALGLARGTRTELEAKIYPILKAYRAKVGVEFVASSAIVATLPLLTPLPGHTPKPVVAQAVFEAVTQQAKISWPASTDSELDHYELRWSPGSVYASDAESTLGSVAPGAPLEFLTAQGLTAAGSTSVFKVYVVLKTGNEAGSEAVAVTRP